MTPKFTKTKIKEKELLGEKLAKKRVSLGYEIKDAERAIKIRAKHIEFIEKGEWEKLPPDVFVRGFLKSYARYLRLDPEKVMGLYYKERGMQEHLKSVTAAPNSEDPKAKATPKIVITPRRLTIVSVVIVALSVLVYIGWQVSILTAAPKLDLNGPADNTETTESSVIIEGSTDAGSSVFINDIPIGVDPEGTFKEEVGLQEGINLIKISAKNKLDKETETTRTIIADLEEAVISNEDKTKELSMKIDIGPNSTAINIVVDGKAISGEDSVMLPGSSQTIRASRSIIITASDSGSVRITLNNEDLGKLGESGKRVDGKEFSLESIGN